MRNIWGDEIVDAVTILTDNDPHIGARDAITVAEAITEASTTAN